MPNQLPKPPLRKIKIKTPPLIQALLLRQWLLLLLHSRRDQVALSCALYHQVVDYKRTTITVFHLPHQLLPLHPQQVRVSTHHHPHFFRILINDQHLRHVSIFTHRLLLFLLLFVSLLTDLPLLTGQYPFPKRITATRSRLRKGPVCALLQHIEARSGAVCIKTVRFLLIRRCSLLTV